jgi:hypothetical protein
VTDTTDELVEHGVRRHGRVGVGGGVPELDGDERRASCRRRNVNRSSLTNESPRGR